MINFISNALKTMFGFILNIVLGVLGCFFILGSLGGYIQGETLASSIVLILGAIMLAYGSRSLWYKKNTSTHVPIKNIRAQELVSTDKLPVTDVAKEKYAKAVADFNAINDLMKKIQDPELVQQLYKMQGIASKMLQYMQLHPLQINSASQYITYYQPETIKFCREFLEFEEMGVDNPDVQDIKQKTKITLSSFDEAYEEQFGRMLATKMLEVDSKLQVANQVLSEEGIRNTSNDLGQQPSDSSAQTPFGRFQK